MTGKMKMEEEKEGRNRPDGPGGGFTKVYLKHIGKCTEHFLEKPIPVLSLDLEGKHILG